MRTKLYNLMAWIVCLTMASCTNQEIIEQAIKPVHSNTLNVLTEKQESRSVLSYEGTFYWTENDYIGVFGTETENARFHFTSQADGVSTFTGNMNASEEKVSWAYFPYSEKMDVSKKQLSFPMPAERTISNENHSPMIGRIETNNTVRFYHTGGILHLKIVGLPEHAAQLVIASEGENSPCLAGTAVIDDITADGCTYRIDNGSKEVVYDVRNLKGGEYIYSIYMPLQIDTYEKIKVTLKNEVGGIIKERSLSNLIVTRGKMTDTPMLNFSEKEYAYPIPMELLEDSILDGAVIFSNGMLVVHYEDIEACHYYITNLFNNNGDEIIGDVISMQLDKERRIRNMIVGNNLIFFSNYKDGVVDVAIMGNNDVEIYKEQVISYIDSRSDTGLEQGFFETMNDFYNKGKMAQDLCSGNFIGPIIDELFDPLIESRITAGGQYVSKIVANTVSEAASYAVLGGSKLGKDGAVLGAGLGALKGLLGGTFGNLPEYLERKKRQKLYEEICGDSKISTRSPILVDENTYDIGYIVSNVQKGSSVFESYRTCGLLFNKTSIGSFSVRRLNYKTPGVEKYGVRILETDTYYSNNVTLEPGYKYEMRGYIAINAFEDDFPVCFLGEIESVSVTNEKIITVDVSRSNFSDGKFKFKVKAKAECYTGKNWSLAIYKNNVKNKEQSFLSNTLQETEFEVDVSKKSMDYAKRKAVDNWELALCTIPYYGENDVSFQATTKESLELKYDKEPTIDLNVRIMPGYPRKINNSRAADDDDEEKWIVKYEVTAETKGSGWIDQVRINVDGRPMKTGHPKNEGESFTYTGSKTYKDKSELPTISCEGTLINGAGNIQSLPASINVASKL